MTEKYVKVDDIVEFCDTNIACLQGQSVAQAALRRVKEYVTANAADAQPVKCCRMIPLEPDLRGCTNIFICTNCHQHIKLGFIRKEYSGSYCLECGAEVKEGAKND